MTFDLKKFNFLSFVLPVSFYVVITTKTPTDCEIVDAGINKFYIVFTATVKNSVVAKFALH